MTAARTMSHPAGIVKDTVACSELETDMQKREKLLLFSAVAVLLLWRGLPIISGIFFDPITDARAELNAVEKKLADKTADIKRLKLAGQTFKQSRGRSLPPNALDAQRQYQVWLDDLARMAGIEKPVVIPGRRAVSRRKSVRGDLFTGVLVSLEFKATLSELSRFLYLFYRSNLAHRVVDLNIDSPENRGNPELTISLTAEGLSFASAPKRSTLFPQAKLKQNFDSSATSLTVETTKAAGFPKKSNYRIRIGNEFLTVTGVKGSEWTVLRGEDETSKSQHDAGDVIELAAIHADYASWTAKDFKTLVENSPFVKPPPKSRPSPRPRPPAPTTDRVAETRLRGSIVIDDEPQAWLYGKSADDRLVIREGEKLEVDDFNAIVRDILADHVLLERDGSLWRLDLGENLRSLQKLAQVDTTAVEEKTEPKTESSTDAAQGDDAKPESPASSATDNGAKQPPVVAPAPAVDK
ncbi:MAG: hypothetical protein HON53_24110 [Planctomycetaceae bacterium]|jgi:hypothetical protein|nr:hypothetical protein [Planctomycetaceae bacterium]MBT6153820.1 hypothetical protein [Planctomycetaceae bacterium]MBT6485735.1 hypothetical protein [Planctomycetaceae bacterium]MBT6497892.1 hypothetical protein [Planctomycetaceae bacterium]